MIPMMSVQDCEGLPLEIHEGLASDGQGMDSWHLLASDICHLMTP